MGLIHEWPITNPPTLSASVEKQVTNQLLVAPEI